MKIFLVTLLLLITTNLFAMTIKSIDFNGMVHISKPVALRMLTFDVGDTIDATTLDKAIKKYYNQGYFNDIWAEFDNGNLHFTLKRKLVYQRLS